MIIEPEIWSKLHGAATHFPIALVMVSAFCDGVSMIPGDAERQRGFRGVATVTIVLGALGGYGAVFTGLIMSKWQVWGHGTLLRHHQFVWPAFALITALGTWRFIARQRAARGLPIAYLVLLLLAVAAMSGAGYWGGELINRS